MAKIKGKWLWNETVSPTRFSQYVNFTSKGMAFVYLGIYTTGASCDFTYETANDDIVFVGVSETSNEPLTFHSAEYRLIDFGETEQEVSEYFYNYLVENATRPIAEKLTQIAENEQKVYDAGIEEGKQSEYDLFWDTFQQKGARTAYERAFAEAGSGALWQAGTTYKPKYPIAPTRADDMYYATRLPYEALKEVDFSNCTTFRNTFAYASTPHLGVIDARKATVMNNAFMSSNAITTIDKLIVAETTPFVNTFVGCKNLTNIVVEGTIAQNGLDFSSCTKLSNESIRSIMNHLSSSTVGLKITLSKAAVDKAFETSEGANDGSENAWWTDNFVDIINNWTIALV